MDSITAAALAHRQSRGPKPRTVESAASRKRLARMGEAEWTFAHIEPAYRIRLERSPLPSHDLKDVPLRQWAAAVCTAEVKHAVEDFWHIVHRHGFSPVFDHYKREEEAAPFRLPHEVKAATVLNFLSHRQAEEHLIRQAKRETRPPADAAYLAKLEGRQAEIEAGFYAAVAAYRAERAGRLG